MKLITEQQTRIISGAKDKTEEFPISNEILFGAGIGFGAGLAFSSIANTNLIATTIGTTLVGGIVGHLYKQSNEDKEHFSLKIDI